MERKFNRLCEEMLREWLGDCKQFKMIFNSSSSRDPVSSFHRSCDKAYPTITIYFTSDDSVFGGYTSETWDPYPHAGAKMDKKAFLFKLYDQSTFLPKKYPVEKPRFAVYCHSDFGPTFGGSDSSKCDRDVETRRPHSNQKSSSGFTVTSNVGQSYSNGKLSNENYTFSRTKVTKFQVFQIIDDEEYIEKAWRNVTNIDVESLKKELKDFQPPSEKIEYTNILLVGQIGAGKSSYLNSVISAFRGHVTSSVPIGSAATSLTLRNEEHKVLAWPEKKYLKFRFWDTRGLEEPINQTLINDLLHIIRGRPPGITKRLFSMLTSWNPWRQHLVPEQDLLQQRVHCIVFVIDGTVLNVLPRTTTDAFGQIRTFANDLDIPQIVLLTKIDKVCPMVDTHLSLTFHSKTIKDLVDQAAELIGVSRAHVCPVKNYEQETELEDEVDRLTLLSLRQMVRFADDPLCKRV